MPNPHYQRVLQQDQALPAPLRWLSRAMSSWWLTLVLAGYVVAYVAAAHAPILGKYLWQWRLLDTTQHAVLTWWPLMIAAWLLAAVVIWSAMRRLPWRTENLGAFIAVIGLAIILVSQSWAFRSQTVGIAAVPLTASTGNTQADALSLSYTTRYGDTHDRVLVVMVGGAAPITIPLDGLPRWNDASGDAMPALKLHDHPKLAPIIGFGTRMKTSAYIAEGELVTHDDGTQTADAFDGPRRHHYTRMPYPNRALLAIEITADTEDGGTQTTTAWLPFEPEGADALVPKHFYEVQGLGSVGLAFRPASKKLPFALAAVEGQFSGKSRLELHIADTDANGKLLQPISYDFGVLSGTATHRSIDDEGRIRDYSLKSVGLTVSGEHALFEVATGRTNPFILAGLVTFVLGVLVDRGLVLMGSLKKYGDEPPAASRTRGQSSTANKTP